ncbi:MAG: alginate lyase family protein [Sedimentisphaerales bacterium]|nr:alginate lyase family protein [Sedimentisphaerales bacterium]
MQTLNWYYRRLRTMPASEIAWRVRSSLRDHVDRCLLGRRRRWRPLSEILNGDGSTAPGFRVCGVPVGSNGSENIESAWLEPLIARADKIAQHRLSFFDLNDKHLGDPILWNRDHKRGQDTPLVFSPALDYRDVNEAGDCKFVWEPNRHHQLVVLARAYRATGDPRYAHAVAEQLDSWLRQNPFGLGMNWRNGLELGIRLINWVWAIDLIEESGAISDELRRRLLDSVSRHIWEIDRKYSRGSSVGNHLIGEAAGVFVATSYFRTLRHASTWRQRSWEILNRQIIQQTYPDGGNREHTVGYHLFVLQFFVVAGVAARATGRDFPASYGSRLEKMFEFLATLSEGGDRLPAFGDGDDGYVLDLGRDPRSVREWLAVGAALFARGDFMARAGGYAEPVKWLLGESGRRSLQAIRESSDSKCVSKALSDSGYYLLQCGDLDSPDRISVVFDCAPLGLEPLAGHGHADALSFTLRAFGRDVLVDPGTYDYFSYPAWRKYFRSTRAHNTIVIDDQDQSEMLGLFLWGRKARARCLCWEPTDTGGRVVGEHDGYTHLEDPVIHRREIELDCSRRALLIHDDIISGRAHDVSLYLHLAEHCVVTSAGENCFLIDIGPGTIELQMDCLLKMELLRGSDDPIGGWVSRGYHQKEPAATLVGRCVCEGHGSLTCRVHISGPKTNSQ